MADQPAAVMPVPARRAAPAKVVRFSYRLPAPLGAAFKAFAPPGWESWLSGIGSALQPALAGAVGDTEELRVPHKQVAHVAACVGMTALTQAAVPMRIWDRNPDEKGAQEVTDGEVVRLLRRPTPLLDELRFRVLDAVYSLVYNESLHFLLDKNGDPVGSVGTGPTALIDLPAEIVPVRGDLAWLHYEPQTGLPDRWQVSTAQARQRDWPLFAVVQHYEQPDTTRPFRGLGRVAACFGPAAQLHLAERYQNFLLRNAGDPGGVITIDGVLAADEKERLDDEVRENWTGAENAGDWHVVAGPGNPKVQALAHSAKDMEYPTLWKARKEDISAVMGVPDAILGGQDQTYATARVHWQQFLKLTIRPRLEADESAWNEHCFARMRDPQLRRMRVRYDVEALAALFADLTEQGTAITSFTGAGVPLNQALLLSSIKTDPIPGGDVGLIAEGRVPLEAAIIIGRAKAARALQDARVDPAAALAEVGLGHLPVVEPEPEEDEDEPGVPAAGGDEEKARALPAPPARAALPAPPVAAKEASGVSRGERTEEWRRDDERQSKFRQKMGRGIRRVFREMKVAQMQALEQYAKEGRIDRAADVPAVYSDPAPHIPAGAARQLLAAWLADMAEGAAIEREETESRAAAEEAGDPQPPSRLKRTLVLGCEVRDVDAPWRPRQGAWLTAHAKLAARATLERLRELAWMQRATLTEEQLDYLIVLTEARWGEALADKVLPVTVEAYAAFAKDISEALGVAIVDVENPLVMAALRSHAIKVVEGTQSVVALRMRSDIISVLAGHGDFQSLQQVLKDSLEELRATTTQAFSSHHARALAIARTEVGGAANRAKFDELTLAYQEGVISGMQWTTSGKPPEPEGPTRLSHYNIDGEVRVPGVPFSNGLLHPHDPNGPAREVVNCVCTPTAVLA